MSEIPKFTGKKVPYSISLPIDMIEALRQRAKEENRPIARIVRRAIIRELLGCDSGETLGMWDIFELIEVDKEDEMSTGRTE